VTNIHTYIAHFCNSQTKFELQFMNWRVKPVAMLQHIQSSSPR